jgi:hypothetical protein
MTLLHIQTKENPMIDPYEVRPGTTRLYDGRRMCDPCCDQCPVVDLDEATGIVTIHDPVKPENGRMTMTALEWDALVKNARQSA